jgi:N-acetylglucosaminyldiphosphoundecaprenol N-acetyl-beta-D-mannosaminyltransferase
VTGVTATDVTTAPPERSSVLGFDIDRVTLAEAVDRVRELVQQPCGHGLGLVATVNPEMLMLARQDAGLAAALHGAGLVVADGIGVVWAARRLGQPVPGRVTGVALADALLEEAARYGWRVCLLGGKPGVAEAAAAEMQARMPGLQISGTHHGYFSPEDAGTVAAAVAAAQPDLVFVGMGAGKQEKWIWQNRQLFLRGVALGLGGVLDIWAGQTKRAPGWLQRLGLEWLYRLVREPSRWRRQLVLPKFVWQVWRGG